MNLLKHFWFRFEKFEKPTPLNLGCGVTAYDHDDATNLLQERVFAGKEPKKILECIENIDVSTLDKKHVLPNMGSIAIRGIWFPQGYE
jgi:hypothetical protein